MNAKDEALKIAIEAIENLCEAFMLGADWRGVGIYDDTVDALKACKESLEQPTNMVTIPLDKLEDMQHDTPPNADA